MSLHSYEPRDKYAGCDHLVIPNRVYRAIETQIDIERASEPTVLQHRFRTHRRTDDHGFHNR